MKLNLALIVNSIEYNNDFVCLDESDPMRYIDVIPYLSNYGNNLAENILYIFKWDQLKTYTGNLDTVLCIGGGDEAIACFKQRRYHGAIFNSKTDIFSLLCSIRIIFNHFNQLEFELMELLSKDAPTK